MNEFLNVVLAAIAGVLLVWRWPSKQAEKPSEPVQEVNTPLDDTITVLEARVEALESAIEQLEKAEMLREATATDLYDKLRRLFNRMVARESRQNAPESTNDPEERPESDLELRKRVRGY